MAAWHTRIRTAARPRAPDPPWIASQGRLTMRCVAGVFAVRALGHATLPKQEPAGEAQEASDGTGDNQNDPPRHVSDMPASMPLETRAPATLAYV